jgi:hypothetical protein
LLQAVAPAVENWPATQLVQTVEAVSFAYLPASQLLQAVTPATEYWPATQLLQTVEAAAAANLPASQLAQVEAPVSPGEVVLGVGVVHSQILRV